MKTKIIFIAFVFAVLGIANAQTNVTDFYSNEYRSRTSFINGNGIKFSAEKHGANYVQDSIIGRNNLGNIVTRFGFPKLNSAANNGVEELLPDGNTMIVSGVINYVSSFPIRAVYTIDASNSLNLMDAAHNMERGPMAADNDYIYKVRGAVNSNFNWDGTVDGSGSSVVTYPSGATAPIWWLVPIDKSTASHVVTPIMVPYLIERMGVLNDGNIWVIERNITSQNVGFRFSIISKSDLLNGNFVYLYNGPLKNDTVYVTEDVLNNNFYMSVPGERKIYRLDSSLSVLDFYEFDVFRPKEIFLPNNNTVFIAGGYADIINGIQFFETGREIRKVMTRDLKPLYLDGNIRFEGSSSVTTFGAPQILDVSETTYTMQFSWEGEFDTYPGNTMAIDNNTYNPTTGTFFPGVGEPMNSTNRYTLTYTVDYTPKSGEDILGVIGGDVVAVHTGQKLVDNAGVKSIVSGAENDIVLVVDNAVSLSGMLGQILPDGYVSGPENVYVTWLDANADWVIGGPFTNGNPSGEEAIVEFVDDVYTAFVIYKQNGYYQHETHIQKTQYATVYLVNENSLSVNNELLPQISIYPNPTNDFIKITNLNTETKITVFNSLGQKVKETTIQNNENINVSKLSKGVYYIKIDNKKGVKFIKK